MNELETQVAKIQISNAKQTNAYVFTLAEKIDSTDSELYIVCELPLFNPAAESECERICEAIAGSLRRSYRKPVNDNAFENALAQLNEELGKLAPLGKTHWIDKLNALVAVKHKSLLSVATVGKISALLLREGRFMTVAESGTPQHPLKTFENFAVGKLKLGDVLIFSTTQLYNHLSVDRLKNVLEENDLAQGAAEVIAVLRDNAGPEVSFATIIALQVESGYGRDQEIDLAKVLEQPVQEAQSWPDRLRSVSTKALGSARDLGKGAMIIAKNPPRPNLKKLVTSNRQRLGLITEHFKSSTKSLRPSTLGSFSRQKKFFFIAAVILFIALIANVAVTGRYKSTRNETQSVTQTVEQLQKLATDANSAFLYADLNGARDMLKQLNDRLAQVQGDKNYAGKLDEVKAQADELQGKLEKRTDAKVETLAALGAADHLIALPGHLATEVNRTIVSYNRSSGSVQDNALKSSEQIIQSSASKNNFAVIHNGKELLLWNYQSGLVAFPNGENVPNKDQLGGLEFYPANNKVYVVDKANKKILNYTVGDKAIGKAAISVENAEELGGATDLAVDGNIYITSGGTIVRFQSGKKTDFNPALTQSLSGNAKIITQSDFRSIYVMDPGNRKVVVLDKNGALVHTFVSPEFNNLRDFSVDEKNKTVYLLNGSSLLKFSF